MDWILYTIIAVFVAWEAVAHFIFHNHIVHTLSNRILWLETNDPTRIAVRVIVAAAVAALGVHLEGVF